MARSKPSGREVLADWIGLSCALLRRLRYHHEQSALEPIDPLLSSSLPRRMASVCQRLIVVYHDRNIVAGDAPTNCVQSGEVLGQRWISEPELNGPKPPPEELELLPRGDPRHSPSPRLSYARNDFGWTEQRGQGNSLHLRDRIPHRHVNSESATARTGHQEAQTGAKGSVSHQWEWNTCPSRDRLPRRDATISRPHP